jgi:hypothetical protein
MLRIGKDRPKREGARGRVRTGIRFVWDRSRQTWVDLRDEVPQPKPSVPNGRASSRPSLGRPQALLASAAGRIKWPRTTWKVRVAAAFIVFVGGAVALTGLIGIGGGDDGPGVSAPSGQETVPNDAVELSVSWPTNRWVDFYSLESTLDGAPLPPGSAVMVYDPDGVLCGAFLVDEHGAYGVLPVYGDDPDTEVDEGAQIGDRLEFRINGASATPTGPDDPVWTEMGPARQVNLAASSSE